MKMTCYLSFYRVFDNSVQWTFSGLLPEPTCKKSSAKAAMVLTAAKHQAVAALHYMVLAIADFATLFGGVGESCFLSKKVAKWYKRPKDC
jgi:hypothetical protein